MGVILAWVWGGRKMFDEGRRTPFDVAQGPQDEGRMTLGERRWTRDGNCETLVVSRKW